MDHSLKIFVDHVSKTKKDVTDVPQSGWYLQNTWVFFFNSYYYLGYSY